MGRHSFKALGISALALVGAAVAVPVADPVYTFCELEDNDLCVDAQVLNASIAVASTGEELARDCFFLTGKLQEDCVWDFQPKCAVRALDKPLQCYDSNRNPVPGQFYEPLRASSDSLGRILNLTPGIGDRTIRLAVGAFMDALDGTVNGLNQNSPHGETGEVTLKLVYDGDDDDGPFRGSDNDVEYVFRFKNGADALRVAFVIPAGVTSVDIYCCNDTGTQEICYDVDFYHVTNLIPNRNYCITVVGGLDEFCDKTETVLGWFDKQWQQLPGVAEGTLAELCILSDGEGDIRFGVSGFGDSDFDGLYDPTQSEYYFFRLLLELLEGIPSDYRMGASTKDASADDVVRYPRPIWDNPNYATYFSGLDRIAPEVLYSHDECGEYCIKIRLAEHVDPSERPVAAGVMGPHRADLNLDETVNAADLALLLSFWGPVPAQ